MTTLSTSTGANLERALRHWRERGALLELPPAKATIQPMTICISRQCGAGGTTIANALVEKLGWPLYDRQLVDKIAEDTGVHKELLGNFDEKQPNWLAECFEGLSAEKRISGVGFAIRLKKILVALYCHGDCIVLGRGAAQILPSKRSLFVRVVAPIDCRVSKLSVSRNIGKDEATKLMDEVDRGRDQFVRTYFHKDPGEPASYDLVVNTSSLGESACTDLILSALESRRSNSRQ